MSFFNLQIPSFLAHLPEDTDDTSDTEDDSGIADETETETESDPSSLPMAVDSLGPQIAQFPDLKITDPISVQNHALNSFFHYW